MVSFLSGIIMMGFFVAGLFFFRFWHKTRDRFFATFSLAFWLLAVERIVLAFSPTQNEAGTYVYLLRLAAFLAIIYAIVEKNRQAALKD